MVDATVAHEGPRVDARQVWMITGSLLVIAALAILAAGIFQAAEFSHDSNRDRLQLLIQLGLSLNTAGLLLGAAIAFRAVGARARSLQTAVMIFAVVVAAGAIYTVFNVLTIHIPGVNLNDSASIGISPGGWKERLSAMLPSVAAGAVAIAAIAVARVHASSMEVAATE
jgi:hypothetical protein